MSLSIRGYSYNVLLRNTARVLGIPTVSELLNLFPEPATVADVTVAPSTYAALHDSVVTVVSSQAQRTASDCLESIRNNSDDESSRKGQNNDGGRRDVNAGIEEGASEEEGREGEVSTSRCAARTPHIVVIPPSVDLKRFNIAAFSHKFVYHTPQCRALDGSPRVVPTRIAGSEAPTAAYREEPMAPLSDPTTQHNFAHDSTSKLTGEVDVECVFYSSNDPFECTNVSSNVPVGGVTVTADGVTVSSKDPIECVSVGFVARLAAEKSPGLFLQAAYQLLTNRSTESHDGQARYKIGRLGNDLCMFLTNSLNTIILCVQCPFDIRVSYHFTVVGDGALRASLEELVVRLGIKSHVTFTGWVGETLPQVRGDIIALCVVIPFDD